MIKADLNNMAIVEIFLKNRQKRVNDEERNACYDEAEKDGMAFFNVCIGDALNASCYECPYSYVNVRRKKNESN